MRFRVNGAGWPVGSYLLPAGTVIDTVNGVDQWSVFVAGSGISAPPADATPLDHATFLAMNAAYTKAAQGPAL